MKEKVARALLTVSLLCVGFALAACGGFGFAPGAAAPAERSATPRATAAPSVLPTPTPSPSRPLPSPTATPDFDRLARYMLELVNRDRAASGVEPVEWDETAALAARLHAEEMAVHGYLSHWDLMGRGPEYRYWLAGGRDVVRENVYSYYQRYRSGGGVPIADWREAVARAQDTLMTSPVHRENILQPSHTHVGIGIAYEPGQGELRIAQEFVDRYVVLDAVPAQVSWGQAITISGRVLAGASSPLINLAYEPFPQPMTVEELNATHDYASVAEVYLALNPDVGGDRFWFTTRLGSADKPGLYHVRIWVAQSGQQILASELLFELR